MGPGLFRASSGSSGDQRSFYGGSVSGHLAIGSRTQRGLVVGAAYSHDAIYSLSAEDELIDGDEPNLDEVRFSMSLFGLFIDVYPSGDVGPHLEFLVGIANLNVTRNQGSNDIDNPTGLGGSIGAGYNFRVGEKTSLGALLRLVYAPTSVEEQTGTSVDSVIPALLLTGSLF